jgi:hypothetical protein
VNSETSSEVKQIIFFSEEKYYQTAIYTFQLSLEQRPATVTNILANSVSWLVGSLFYDAFLITRLHSVNDRVISE